MKAYTFNPGMRFKAIVPFSNPEPIKVHICHVLPSIYEDSKLIVYRVFSKHKRCWHELLCTCEDMKWYMEKYEIISKNNPKNSLKH